MKERKIKPVDSRENKRQTYAAIMRKYKKAIESGFYGEAELIVYAYLEDRLRSFIYYSNGIDNWDSNHINDNMISILDEKKSIEDINSKIEVIRKAIDSKRLDKLCPDNHYAAYLSKIYKISFDEKEVKSLIKKIDDWRGYRNEVVHALLNKDLEDLHLTFRSHVEEGYSLARRFDNVVSSLKRA